jgi:hypothetical protein
VVAASYSFTRVAVKQLPAGTQLPPAAVAALEAEAALQARLSHEHVVRVYGFAVSTANPARPKYGLVMARLHEPLQRLLARAAAAGGAGGGAPPIAWRLSAVHQVAVGLAHLHARRVAHGYQPPPPPPEVEEPPAGLFKRCPGRGRGGAPCGVPIQHARGHHCHHIAPGTGCTQCGTHFCYRCLRVYLPGEPRTRCPTGCPLFCNDTCDCPDCVECKPGPP